MIFKTVFVTLLLVLAACAPTGDAGPSDQEIAVYLTVSKRSPSTYFVIGSGPLTAIGLESVENVKQLLPEASEDTIEDFLARNREIQATNRDKPIRDGFTLIGTDDRSARLERVNRYNSVSRVGFNSSGDEAILWYFDDCQPLCGSGGLYLLRKRDSEWVVVGESEKIKT
jgi:hypothetical protein